MADFGRRFDELCEQAEAIESKKRMERPEYGISGYRVDQNELLNWLVKVRHLIASVCGQDSQHFKLFIECEKGGMYTTNHEVFRSLRAVLLAAKEDYEGGYLKGVKHLIQERYSTASWSKRASF